MEKGYRIKGINKILETVSKADLANFFGVEQDADFETLITESLQTSGVPNGLEIAGYEAVNYEDMENGVDGYLQDVLNKYVKDGKAAIGISYPITNADMAELYILIDEPIKDSDLYNIQFVKTHLGGVSTLGYTMGKGFYEAHKDEISKFQEEVSKSWDDQRAFDDYVRDYFDRLSGKKKPENENYFFDWQRERAQEEKERMASAENLISQLTGGKSIQDVTLQELEQIKQGLIARQQKVQEAFAQRFGTKENVPNKE